MKSSKSVDYTFNILYSEINADTAAYKSDDTFLLILNDLKNIPWTFFKFNHDHLF